MPSDYTLERTHGQETVIIHAADLYLLEQWHDHLSISDEAQRSAIFSKWLEIGSRGRMWKPYVERLEEMSISNDDITNDEKDLLARVRNPSDRQDVSYTRLIRTFYGEGSNTNFAALISEAEFDQPVFDNEGNVLLVYIDDHGRVLRYSRLDGALDLQDADGMLCSGQDFMHAWWEDGRYGEDWQPHQLAKRWGEIEYELSEEGARTNVMPDEQST